MESIENEVARLRSQLRVVTDRSDVRDLVERYVVGLDTLHEPEFDESWYRTVFTEDARLDFPVGSHRGVKGLARFQREAKGRWARTHHLGSNSTIHFDGDRAEVRAHLIATHVHHDDEGPHFNVGTYFDIGAVRTPDGWRIDRLACRVVWTAGKGLASVPGADRGSMSCA
ncbi:hypothetical protein GCM10011583_68140 [Streptomyces camponoticapitis]|uniref:SnoaL-like domain-containing protein n=1 Tax=Streptomyces camponoticapitis TaxID=1616125 RepID=A0ABQ2EU41_9ACTN|nr:nuclear transport factor 2 family protein [Streptomyces camponoticapitis]GGK26522.1 hypothetical protein GCM10011583_68140 [Streptomyces camponoticapitis]